MNVWEASQSRRRHGRVAASLQQWNSTTEGALGLGSSLVADGGEEEQVTSWPREDDGVAVQLGLATSNGVVGLGLAPRRGVLLLG